MRVTPPSGGHRMVSRERQHALQELRQIALKVTALRRGAGPRRDGLRWPRRDGLKWPRLASVIVLVDLA